ncbi:MAG: hypothetical protein CNLJKLNK_00803 [Holosporales bacterium]
MKALGKHYELGSGVAMDKQEALKLYEQAAQRGDKDAEKFALIMKVVIAQIKKEALDSNVLAQLKERAQLDAVFMVVLYKVYNSGVGEWPASSPEALAEEIKWLRCAVNAGNVEAMKALGKHYELGSGVAMDKQEALKLYEQAAQRGDKDAENFVLIITASITLTNKETLSSNVLEQFKERAQSAPEWMVVLYKVYVNGIGGYAASSPEALAEGIKWLRRAVNAGNTQAMKTLGVHYEHGNGIPMDKQEALKLYEQAAQRGDKDAEKFALILKEQQKETLDSSN